MSQKILWLVVSGLMALSLVMAACGPTAVEEKKSAPLAEEKKPAPVAEDKKQEAVVKDAVKPAPEAPKYGGMLRLPVTADITDFDSNINIQGGLEKSLTKQGLQGGDWAKGPAGGYGTGETSWIINNELMALKTGYVAENTKWTADFEKDRGTIIFQIRRGIHYSLNPASEASRLVGGRELTADDVVASMKKAITPGTKFVLSSPELKDAEIVKTGPWEVTVKLPVAAVRTALNRFGDNLDIQPPEVAAKYGNMSNWKNVVGSGAFMITDYLPGSQLTMVRNPNFWLKDPVGPGKGNQLPYLDAVRVLIIPDLSTRMAALRTAKIDQLNPIAMEDMAQLRKTTPALVVKETITTEGRGTQSGMRNDMPPFNDVRVRRAMYMATDFNAINQSLFGGRGQIHNFPYTYTQEYAGLYLGIDDPMFPESAKELYKYNPEKAKQLLKEAGYPNGFKFDVLLVATEVDYYSILKDMWAKVGIEAVFMVRESAVANNMRSAKTHPPMTNRNSAPIAIFTVASHIAADDVPNVSMVNDPYINEMMIKVRKAALTDDYAAMKLFKEMTVYIVDQAFSLPNVIGPWYIAWWPWLKNYSGELRVGYQDNLWPQWVWLDQELKKSMGY